MRISYGRSDVCSSDLNDKATLLAQVAEGLDGEHLWWLSGYIAGLARSTQAPARTLHLAAAEATPDTGTPATLTIVYGSQTGNAKRMAETLAQQARDAGIAVRLLRADAYPTPDLKDRKSGGEGKRGSVRGEHGGHRNIKKKTRP